MRRQGQGMNRHLPRSSWLAALAPLLLATGCRFGGVPGPEPIASAVRAHPELSVAREAGTAPFRVAVAPVRVSYSDPAALFPRDDLARHGAVPDLDRLRREVVEGLEAAGLFERAVARGAAGESEEAVEDLAWDESDDLLLELTVRRYHQEYLGRDGYVLWFLVYTTWVWPAFNMPVDTFGAGLELHARLRCVGGDVPPLLDEVYRVRPEEVAAVHTPSDRELAGFLDMGALWDVESSLDESNWQAIERNVGPHARRRALLQLLSDLEARVARPLRGAPGPRRDELLDRIRKRLALVVGITGHAAPELGEVPHAASDARALAELFGTPRGGGLTPGRDLTLLVDGQATQAAIREAVAAIASRAAPSDEVVVYFAGLGAVGPAPDALATGDQPGTRYLVPHDARPGDLAGTAIDLAALVRELDALSAGRVVLVVDAAFPGGAAPVAPPSPGPGRAVVLSTRAGQQARVLPQAGSLLFSQVLRDGILGGADRNGDDRVELEELLQHLEDEVASRAGLEGFAQQPWVVGAEPPSLSWPRQ